LYGEGLPAEVQTAENLYRHGLIDAVVPPADLRDVAIRVLNVVTAPRRLRTPPSRSGDSTRDVHRDHQAEDSSRTWDSITRSRRPDRPGVRALLRIAATDVTPLSGTGAGERDDALLLALARFGEMPCVLVGQDRHSRSEDQNLGPAGLREAVRGMRIARDLELPLVTVVDNPGASLSRQSEEGGLAHGIAQCLIELSELATPTVCALLGEGGGGTALALLPADRVLCAEHAWLAPLPPEGAAEVLHKTMERAGEVAEAQGAGSTALVRDGVADRIIPEFPDAADEPETFMRRVGAAIEEEISALRAADTTRRLAARAARYRPAGP
jgi:acetyl-CoA carboxylase carboxyl transferase subunit beta